MSKILDFETLKTKMASLRRAGKKIVLCHGVFDLMHPGHILHFKAAKAHGDVLVVTLTKDEYVFKGPGRPYFNQKLRLETIAALEVVDYVALNEWPVAVETIRQLKPDVYAKGSDYAVNTKDVTGNIALEAAAVQEVGGRIIYTDEETFSSSTLINTYFQNHPEETRNFLDRFKKRHAAEEIVSALKGLRDLRVLVVGEAILDQYFYCEPLAKAPKDIIVSGRYLSEENFAGGSLAVANHLANFCGEVTLVTVTGREDEHLDYFRSKLLPNVNFFPLVDNDRPTIIKRRFVTADFLKKMFEIQYMRDEDLTATVESEVTALAGRHAPKADLTVIADFGHGMMTPKVKQSCFDHSRFIALNTQSNSANMGYNPITAYARADYVAIDEPELRFASHSKYGSVEELAGVIRKKLEAKYFMVSLGAAGNVFLMPNGAICKTPVFSQRVIDRTGAGDALFAVTSPCVYRELDPEVVGFVANCVGAMAVETVCNREPIDAVKLFKFMTYLLK